MRKNFKLLFIFTVLGARIKLRVIMTTATTLECVIRSKDGEVKNVVEVVGEERGYLSNLSNSLCRMQSDVNAHLTELVEKARGQATAASSTQEKRSTSSEEDGKNVPQATAILFNAHYTANNFDRVTVAHTVLIDIYIMCATVLIG